MPRRLLRLLISLIAILTLSTTACSKASQTDPNVVQGDREGVGTAPPVGGARPVPATAAANRAVVKGDSIDVYDSPDAVEPTESLENPWLYQDLPEAPIQRIFLIKGQQDDWLNVYTGEPPSFSEGWVRSEDVTVEPIYYQVDVYLSEFRLTVTESGKPFLETEIAVGTNDRPTVGGDYFTTVLLQPPEPDSVYGAYAYGLNGYSDDPSVQADFGGDGQLGLHGTNQPELLGTNISNGCIRMSNEAITKLAQVLPLGTPVYIHT